MNSARRLVGLVCCFSAAVVQAADGLPVVSLLSVANTTTPATANGNSLASQITPDGKFFIFLSDATDLVPGLIRLSPLNLYVCERTNGQGLVTLASVNANGQGGANDHCTSYSFTPDARFIAFATAADNQVANDTNLVSDVFVRDRQLNQTLLVSSRDGSLTPGNGASSGPAISADGRFVAFVSEADDLVPDDTNRLADVFLRDLIAGTTTRITAPPKESVSGQKIIGVPEIAPDGSFVVFSSSGSNLVAGVTNLAGEVYRYDRIGGSTTWISTGASALFTQATGSAITGAPTSWQPRISADGRFVIFVFSARAVGTPANGPNRDLILRRDLSLGTLSVVATNVNAFPGPDREGPVFSMTPDGAFVTYSSMLTSTSVSQIYRWDAVSGTTQLISVGTDGVTPGSGLSLRPALSGDGHRVVFISQATNLVENLGSADWQVYLRDVDGGTTILVSTNESGAAGGAETAQPSISDDGNLVAWDSLSETQVPGDHNEAFDVFVRDLALEHTEAVSLAAAPSSFPANISWLSAGSTSADGRRVVFTSYASNLTPGDTNHAPDVFVRDLATQSNLVVSINQSGTGTGNGPSHSPCISADGKYVAFASRASDLVAGVDTNGVEDVFVRNLDTGTTMLVSVSTNGVTSASRSSLAPCISADGRWVAFQSTAPDLTTDDNDPSAEDIFLRDQTSGVTRMISAETVRCIQPVISPDGRFTVFRSGTAATNTRLKVFDNADQSLFILATNYALPTFSADSHVLVARESLGWPIGDTLLWFDLYARTSIVRQLPPGIGAGIVGGQSLAVSSDGRRVAFDSRTSAGSPDTNANSDIFVWDVPTDTIRLASVNAAGTAAGNGPSEMVSLSRNGRFVAYRSAASDLVPDDTNGLPDVIVYDIDRGVNLLLSHFQSGAASARGRSFPPSITPDGTAVLFASAATDLVSGGAVPVSALYRATVPVPLIEDTDSDQLDDNWERRWFGDLSRNGTGDADSDGFSDAVEYALGTDPTNPLSLLSVRIDRPAPDITDLSWPAAPGRSYVVQYRDGLENTWQPLPGSVMVIGNNARAGDNTSSPTDHRFYRVSLSIP